MVTGRTLLLADDSVTVQKVVDLTFADEGIEVIAVSDGEQAIAKLATLSPDVILADVFMPKFNGYEVCDFIKRHDRLRHIPVMLLVGSFEPFDEAEARRVGADDYLTKPFQSIRQLVQRVGALLGKKQSIESDTMELPPTTEASDTERTSSDFLSLSTADTKPLAPSMLDHIDHHVADRQEQSFADIAFGEEIPESSAEAEMTSDMKADEAKPSPEPVREHKDKIAAEPAKVAAAAPFVTQNSTSAMNFNNSAIADDALLDLGDLEPPFSSAEADDFILDLRDELTPAPEPIVYLPKSLAASSSAPERATEPVARDSSTGFAEPVLPVDLASAAEYSTKTAVIEGDVLEGESISPTRSTISADAVTPELIEIIARRVVELMSTEVVERIAWEVVPQLSELLIKKQLEEGQVKLN